MTGWRRQRALFALLLCSCFVSPGQRDWVFVSMAALGDLIVMRVWWMEKWGEVDVAW
jgi:hypothetical protein